MYSGVPWQQQQVQQQQQQPQPLSAAACMSFMAQLQYLQQQHQQQQLELQQRALAAAWSGFATLPGLGQAPLCGVPILAQLPDPVQQPSISMAGQAVEVTLATMPCYGSAAPEWQYTSAEGQYTSSRQAAAAPRRPLPAAPAAPARGWAADKQRGASTCSRRLQTGVRQAGASLQQQQHLQQQRQEEEEAQQRKQQQTCTCGECIGGWVSPRLLSELAAAAELER